MGADQTVVKPVVKPENSVTKSRKKQTEKYRWPFKIEKDCGGYRPGALYNKVSP